MLFGGAAGYRSVDAAELRAKGVRFVQPSTGQYLSTPKLVTKAATAVFEELRVGTFGALKPTIYPSRDADLAHTDLQARRTTESILLTL